MSKLVISDLRESKAKRMRASEILNDSVVKDLEKLEASWCEQ
jgi:hypothetical protein